MKNMMIIILLSLSNIAFSQDSTVKKITVNGLAEIEIIPNEIYLQITMKEYKKGTKKIMINKLEEGLVKAVKTAGASEKDIKVSNIYGYNWNWKKRKSEEFLATKSFQVKLSDVKQVNALFEQLDTEGVNQVNVDKTTHSDIDKYRNDLRLRALQNAKYKAEYLLKGIGEELGSALDIQEIEHLSPTAGNLAYSVRSKSIESDYQSNLDFKVIKIRTEVRAVFEIK